ncbi:unknown protein [Azorhizobium caulinodans ORS 571]|uniref:Uncharacterized protein n=1 Tax=Azorhizobium caulinodans (strain ATCC 43989 / DSM 5975 / JCM 20966 / LMG 6465 / NBRC 14845 / NCIMB 13405 / ORS 571) TaxID=438753 RepID=A8IB04_AZOC5|nr:hypothetical protein [Azorhizobium caulinodans]BAF88588.1 unknown protein [Azorhizobium caulinodans ORS 571]
MGIFEKGATTDINSAIQRIMNKAAQQNWDTVTATLASPVDALVTELGPLTGKAGKESTVDAAVMLACVTAQNDQSFLTTVSQIATNLSGATVISGNGSVDSALSLTFNIENFRGAVKENVDAVKGSVITTAPVLVQLLDVILIQSVSAVPYVGPVLSGLLGGFGTGLAAAFTVGGNAIASQFTPPDKTDNPVNAITGIQNSSQGMGYTTATNMNKGISGVISKNATLNVGGMVGKAGSKASGPASFIYYLYKGKSAKDESKRLEQLRGLGDDNAILQSLGNTMVQNPLDQHQLAQNARVQQSRFGGAIPQLVQDAGKNLKDKLQTEEDSLTAFFNKIPDVFDSYKKFVLQVANASLVESFAPMIQSFDSRLAEMRIKLSDPTLGPRWLNTPKYREEHVVTLLILGYYFNRLLKSSEPLRKTYRRHIAVYYRHMPMPGTGSQTTFMLPQDSSVVIPQGQDVVPKFSAFSNVSKNETSSAIISAFNATKSLPQLSLSETAVEWAQIGEKAKTYVSLVKNALVNEMAQGFSQSLNNRVGLSSAVKLYLAATLIVNQVMVQTSAGKGIEIDDRYVASLSDLGFVNLYRKLGSYDKADKLKLTGSGPNAKLRYPMASRLSRSASTAERTMMYLFACCVLAYVDVGRIVMGYQDWTKTQERLHLLIDEINKAEED